VGWDGVGWGGAGRGGHVAVAKASRQHGTRLVKQRRKGLAQLHWGGARGGESEGGVSCLGFRGLSPVSEHRALHNCSVPEGRGERGDGYRAMLLCAEVQH